MARKCQHVMTIDPGLGGTGWCYWPELGPRKLAPMGHGVLTAPAGKSWQARVSWLANELEGLLIHLKLDNDDHDCAFIIEWPTLWTGSAKSMASGEEGDLFKLSYLVGALASLISTTVGRECVLLTPNHWKGQLPKREVLKRVKRLTGVTFEDHEGDAAGMGMYLLGKL